MEQRWKKILNSKDSRLPAFNPSQSIKPTCIIIKLLKCYIWLNGRRVCFIYLVYPPCPVMSVIIKMEWIVTFSVYVYIYIGIYTYIYMHTVRNFSFFNSTGSISPFSLHFNVLKKKKKDIMDFPNRNASLLLCPFCFALLNS